MKNTIQNQNNWYGEFELKVFYDFLDGLTLIQELAFLNTLYIFLTTILGLNIYSIVFANEILRYFQIEEKYPRFQKYFQLRRTYQRYYLVVNGIIFIAFTLIVGGLNLLTLVVVK